MAVTHKHVNTRCNFLKKVARSIYGRITWYVNTLATSILYIYIYILKTFYFYSILM
jgi:hypothetical protein